MPTGCIENQDIQLEGIDFETGDLLLSYHSIDHDLVGYEDDNSFMCPHKNEASHLSFGCGNHFFVWFQVARSVAKIAFEQLFSRLGDWKRLTPSDRIGMLRSGRTRAQF